MNHYIVNDDTNEEVVFETYQPEKMLETIKRMLRETPNSLVKHNKDLTKEEAKKFVGRNEINFYENNPKTGEPSRIVTKGNKELYSPLN